MVDERLLAYPSARKALNELHRKRLNFDLGARDRFTAEHGWRIDDYRQPLPAEQPGPPVAGGSWQAARRLMRDYEFADPKIVRAIYHPDRPLEERDMLLEGRFSGLRFHFGVRVGGVVDETRVIEGRDVRAWGWNYRTLQGHLEMGQMDYEVLKWLDSGAVEFRIHVVSRPAQIRNPLIRLGFRLFGRSMQAKFARHACMRMERLTTAELARQAARQTPEPVPRASHNLIVAPASAGKGLRASDPSQRSFGGYRLESKEKYLMFRNVFRAAWLRSEYLQVASLASILSCVGFWIRAKTVDQSEREHAENRALFVGLWAPTLWLLGNWLAKRTHREG